MAINKDNKAEHKTEKRRIGDIGEEVASKYLINKAFTILDRNYLKPWGEIDIVAEKGNKLHFVEVKSVSSETKNGPRPEENMHAHKFKRLSRAIDTYLLEKRAHSNKDWQIDLVSVYLNFETKKARVELLENVML